MLGVNHVGLTTGDLDEHVAFYRDAAGLPEHARSGWDTADGDSDGDGRARRCSTRATCSSTSPSTRAPRGAALDPQRPINDHGLNHLCFDVSDIDELHAAMVDGGMTFTARPPRCRPASRRWATRATRSATPLELIENRSPKAFMWCGHLRDRPGR